MDSVGLLEQNGGIFSTEQKKKHLPHEREVLYPCFPKFEVIIKWNLQK